MAMRYQLDRIKDHKYLCWRTKRDAENGEQELNPITQALIVLTQVIGVREITQKNAAEFHRRVAFHEHINGAILKQTTRDGAVIARHIHLEDVVEHIGLKTKAEYGSQMQFATRMFNRWRMPRELYLSEDEIAAQDEEQAAAQAAAHTESAPAEVPSEMEMTTHDEGDLAGDDAGAVEG